MVSTGMADQLTAPCWLSLKGWLWTSWATSTSQIRTTIVFAWSTPQASFILSRAREKEGLAGTAVRPPVLCWLFPQGVATDGAGNLYIADAGNNRIRKVDSTGTITTIAGTGGIGFDGRGLGGDGGSATSALLASPGGVALDSAGNLYIADTGNHRIRKLTPGVTLEPVVSAVVNAGSYSRNAAAGAIMSLFGTDLAPGTAFTASSPLPVTLQGTTVTVIGSGGVTREAGLFFVSAGQINFLIPAANTHRNRKRLGGCLRAAFARFCSADRQRGARAVQRQLERQGCGGGGSIENPGRRIPDPRRCHHF